MSNHDITRLVVGESFSLSMGKPVGQSVKSTDVSKTLRYKDGQWESPASLLDITRLLTGTPATVLAVVVMCLTWLTMSLY